MKRKQAIKYLMMLVLWLGFASVVNAQSSKEKSSSIVVLTGILRSETKYGPPGWGETPKIDPKFKIYVLKFQEPLTAKQLSLHAESGEDLGNDETKGKDKYAEIQLWCTSEVPQCEDVLKKAVGHKITVSGEAVRCAEPANFLPASMDILSITDQSTSKRVDRIGN
jgi:hypothetical protein